MKQLRVLISLLLCFALASGLFAGCSKAPADTASATPPANKEESPSIPNKGDTMEAIDLQQADDSFSPLAAFSSEISPEKEHTVMIYMVGSDLETGGAAASKDMKEMKASRLDTDKVNLVVFTGGANLWHNGIPGTKNTVQILKGDTFQQAAANDYASNVGDVRTLLDFLNFAYANYPAKSYSLIFWDHGGGPACGYGLDELTGDVLTYSEMEQALSQSPFAQEKLAFLGFDACLMASIEIAAMVAPYADYLVASEEIEPDIGWFYLALEVLNQSGSVQDFINTILVAYAYAVEELRPAYKYTLSCIDLAKIPALEASMDKLWMEMATDIENGNYNSLSKSFGKATAFPLQDGGSSNLIDIGSLMNSLGEEYSSLKGEILANLEAAVPAMVSNIPSAKGLSVYIPYASKGDFAIYGNEFASKHASDAYINFLDLYIGHWLGEAVVLADGGLVDNEEDSLIFQLHPEDLEYLEYIGGISYTILEYHPEGDSYSLVLGNQPAEVLATGQVVIPRDLEVFTLHSDAAYTGAPGIICPAIALGVQDGVTYYGSAYTSLAPSIEIWDTNNQKIKVFFSQDEGNPQATIHSIISANSSDIQFYGKQDVDISKYNTLYYWSDSLSQISSSNGVMLPWSNWEVTGGTEDYINYDSSFHIEKTSLQDIPGEFYCQVVYYDFSGNPIYTQMEKLTDGQSYQVETVDASEGQFTYIVFDDHAELYAFTANEAVGSEITVTVPETLGNVPVTVLRDECFYSQKTVTGIILPDSIVHIGSGAFFDAGITTITLPAGLQSLDTYSFSGTPLTTITLPAGLSWIGNGAFAGCSSLTEILVEAGNQVYLSIDGVLFSDDGTTLVAFPEAKATSYQIPAGVTTIAPDAFRLNCTLTDITFHEGLLSIEQNAFMDCWGITAIALPDSLESIGANAFASSDALNKIATIETLKLGKNLKYIGTEAFYGYLVNAYEVDPANETYKSVDGIVLNKSGTQLVLVPNGHSGKLVIPEGVSYIGEGAFSNCRNVTTLEIPDSVVGIHEKAGLESVDELIIGKGLKAWNNIKECYRIPTIRISQDNPFYTNAADGSVYTKDYSMLIFYLGTEETLTLHENTVSIHPYALRTDSGYHLTGIYLPAGFTDTNVWEALVFFRGSKIEVDSQNEVFTVIDGKLYSKDGKTLIFAPGDKE